MELAKFRRAGLTDGSRRAAPGGCWIQGVYYPAGYPLPVGTTQYGTKRSVAPDGNQIWIDSRNDLR